jgi:hypothetical protein
VRARGDGVFSWLVLGGGGISTVARGRNPPRPGAAEDTPHARRAARGAFRVGGLCLNCHHHWQCGAACGGRRSSSCGGEPMIGCKFAYDKAGAGTPGGFIIIDGQRAISHVLLRCRKWYRKYRDCQW